jgi:hypothetical protein
MKLGDSSLNRAAVRQKSRRLVAGVVHDHEALCKVRDQRECVVLSCACGLANGLVPGTSGMCSFARCPGV